MSNMLASTKVLNRRWLSVKRSQSDGLSSALWRTSARSAPKRSAVLAMISRSANPQPRDSASRRPISLPRLPAVSEMATILIAHLSGNDADAKGSRQSAHVRVLTRFAVWDAESVGPGPRQLKYG